MIANHPRWLSALLLVFALWAPATAGAQAPRLSEAGESRFPERAFLLSLPTPRDLVPGAVQVEENGRAVDALTVTPAGEAGGKRFGVVLAIDASQTMRGEPIASAMRAARAFARTRLPTQALGVVFFNRNARVELAPTTDGRKIDEALAHPPVIGKGTRLYDATLTSLKALDNANVDIATVLVLSDGADVGSVADAKTLSAAVAKQRARVYAVGLRSASYQASTLRTVAESGRGEYVEGTASQLREIYTRLGAQFANEYLVTYRSLLPTSSEVRVQAVVDGFEDRATAAYTAPKLAPAAAPIGTGDGPPPVTIVGMSLLLAAMLGFALWLAVLRPRRAVSSRVGDYGALPAAPTLSFEGVRPSVARSSLGRSLRASRIGQSWNDAVELSGLQVRGNVLAGTTLLLTAVVVWALLAADREVAALLCAFAPVAVWQFVRSRGDKRRTLFANQLADVLQLVASAMRTGHSFPSALGVALEDAEEPIKSELGRVVRDERLGVPIEEAMQTAATRMKSRELEHAGVVAAIQRESGGSTAEVVDRLVETIRERDELRRMVTTLTAQGKISGLVLTLLPVGLALAMSVTSPDFFDPMLEASSGPYLIAFAVTLIGIGWLTIRKLVDIKI